MSTVRFLTAPLAVVLAIAGVAAQTAPAPTAIRRVPSTSASPISSRG